MADKELDELFRRFVREHDVRAVGELFDAAAPQLARIAWHLTHDASGVEDLVQTTFLTALASAHEFAAERRVMPWLLRILLNHARNARRASERKPEPLAVDLVDPRTPESDLERRELHEVVQRAVADLPDTYREVVATWLIEGATPTEIAQRTGKPAATVRVQLRRGLELLRSGLPAGVAGLLATNGWSASSFAASREVVLAKATRITRTLAPTSAIVAGGLLVTSKWLLLGAAALVTAAGVGWFVHDNTAQPTSVASAPVVDAAELHVPNQSAAVDAPTADRSEVASPQPAAAAEAAKSPAPGWWLICEVSGVSPSATAQLTSPILEGWSANVEGQRFEVDISQFFSESSISSPTSFVVRYDSPGLVGPGAPGFMPTHVLVEVAKQVDLDAAFAAARVELHARFDPRPLTVEAIGRVVVPTDRAAGEAVVALFGFDAHGRIDEKPSEFVRCAEDGSFRVRASSSGEHVLAAALPGMRPATRSVPGDWHVQIDLGEVVLERGEHLAGVVEVDPTTGIGAFAVTARLVGAQMLAFLEVQPRTGPWTWRSTCDLAWIGGRFEWNWPTVDQPVSGEFRIDGLAPLEYDLEVQPGFYGTVDEQIEYLSEFGRRDSVRLTPTVDHVVVPLRSCSVRLEIRAGGQPLDGTSLMLRSENGTDSGVDLTGHIVKVLWSGSSSANVRVSKDGFVPAEITLDPRESTGSSPRLVELSRDASLASLALRPVLQCANDSGMSYDVTLDTLSDGSGEFFAKKSFSLRDREWRFDGVVPGRYLVVVSSNSLLSGLSWCVEPRPEIEVAAGEAALRDLVFQTGGRLAFTVRDSSAATATVRVRGVDSGFRWGFFDPRDGAGKQLTGYEVSAPTGVRVASVDVFEPGALKVTVVLNDARGTQRERTVNIIPGQTTELVVDFSKPDER